MEDASGKRRRADEMTPMHVVHTEASRGWGGQEIRILTEAEGLIRRGHQVTLLCPPGARILAEAQQRKIPAVALPVGRNSPQRPPARLPRRSRTA